MTDDKSRQIDEGLVGFPLGAGDTIILFDDEGVMFADKVEKYSPETGLMEFKNTDTGYAEFKEMASECAGYSVR